jgi:hypothetical protein
MHATLHPRRARHPVVDAHPSEASLPSYHHSSKQLSHVITSVTAWNPRQPRWQSAVVATCERVRRKLRSDCGDETRFGEVASPNQRQRAHFIAPGGPHWIGWRMVIADQTTGGLDAQADAILAAMVDAVVAEAETAAAEGLSAGAQGHPTLHAVATRHLGFEPAQAILTRPPPGMMYVDEADAQRPDPMTTKVRR